MRDPYQVLGVSRDATEEEMIQAAKAAHAHSFIKRMPKGYDTDIGQDGGSLSQGQKQLLCITRVMLSLPPMLILDEATSALDVTVQAEILTLLNRLQRDLLISYLFICHDIALVQDFCDRVIVMNQGKIVEEGAVNEVIRAPQQAYTRKLIDSVL